MRASAIRLHSAPSGARISGASLEELAALQVQRAQAAQGSPGTGQRRPPEVDETQAALESVVAALSRVTGELDEAHAKLQEELPAFAVQLAVGIAQEVLRRELDSGNYDIEAIVRSTLAVADTGRSACTIHVHPDDMEALDPSRFRSNTRFESDPDIARGDVHVSTPQGLLVRDIDATLTRVREQLLEAIR